MDEDLQQRASLGADDIVNVASHKEQDDEKDGTSKGADANADDHDSRTFGSGMGDF